MFRDMFRAKEKHIMPSLPVDHMFLLGEIKSEAYDELHSLLKTNQDAVIYDRKKNATLRQRLDRVYRINDAFFAFGSTAWFGQVGVSAEAFVEKFKAKFSAENTREMTDVQHVYLLEYESTANNQIAQKIADKLYETGFVNVKVHAVIYPSDENAPTTRTELSLVQDKASGMKSVLLRAYRVSATQKKTKLLNTRFIFEELSRPHNTFIPSQCQPQAMLNKVSGSEIAIAALDDRINLTWLYKQASSTNKLIRLRQEIAASSEPKIASDLLRKYFNEHDKKRFKNKKSETHDFFLALANGSYRTSTFDLNKVMQDAQNKRSFFNLETQLTGHDGTRSVATTVDKFMAILAPKRQATPVASPPAKVSKAAPQMRVARPGLPCSTKPATSDPLVNPPKEQVAPALLVASGVDASLVVAAENAVDALKKFRNKLQKEAARPGWLNWMNSMSPVKTTKIKELNTLIGNIETDVGRYKANPAQGFNWKKHVTEAQKKKDLTYSFWSNRTSHLLQNIVDGDLAQGTHKKTCKTPEFVDEQPSRFIFGAVRRFW
jgi:hypothetical protein